MDERPNSRLYTLRIWQEKVVDDRLECRGRLQHVLSGEVRYFRGLPMLVECLESMLKEKEADVSPDRLTT